jgi:hypothetical protein
MKQPSKDYINFICELYGDCYDDQEEDSSPGGFDWEPGKRAAHKSLNGFQKELEEQRIKLSRSKIQKILITGGRWSTERSREVQRLFEEETEKGMKADQVIRKISEDLGVSTECVYINLPYGKGVYGLEEKSANAKRIDQWRKKKRMAEMS